MNSKKPKQEKNQEPKRRRKNKTLSVVGTLALGATLPITVQGANSTVAERIARIREAFTSTRATQGVSAPPAVRSDLVTQDKEREEIAQFANFANFADFNNFSNFQDAFNNFSNSFGNFGNSLP
jgi:hypothetical protein